MRSILLILLLSISFSLYSRINDDTVKYVLPKEIKPVSKELYYESVIIYSKLDNSGHQLTFAFPDNPNVNLVILDRQSNKVLLNEVYKEVSKGDIVIIIPGSYILVFMIGNDIYIKEVD